MIQLNDVAMAFGPQTLFEKVSLQFNPRKRYGLTGPNGSGKSTLLKMLEGKEQPTGGTISIPREFRLGFMDQDHFKFEKNRVVDVVLQGNRSLWAALQEKEALIEAIDKGQTPDAGLANHRLAELEDILAAEEAYNAETQAAKLLTGLGIATEKIHNPLSELSGGYKLRVLLAQVLFGNPDVLILDEPTNHLDIVSIRWLEVFLTGEYEGTVIVVSHDRDFLNSICTHIADIDYQQITLYTGNYDQFLDQKDLALEQKEKEIRQKEKKVAEMEAFVERFRYKATKARQAQSRLKQIEKMEGDMPEIVRSSRQAPVLRFEIIRPSVKRVLVCEDIAKSFGELQVLKNINFEIRRGERIAVIGPNGTGKSTLLKVSLDHLKPDAGEYTWGDECKIGYFSQDHGELGGVKKSVFDWLHDQHPDLTIGQIHGMLARVLFQKEEVKKVCANLSGGEKARLLLAKLMLDKCNVLIMDEPTNHLDLEAVDALEEALLEYEGTLVFVSHNKHFVGALANRIFELSPSGLRDFPQSYADYIAGEGRDFLEAGVLRAGGSSGRSAMTKKSGKADHAERKGLQKKLRSVKNRLAEVETTIATAEARIETIQKTFAQPDFYQTADHDQVIEMDNEKDVLQKKLGGLMNEWEELEATKTQLEESLAL